VRAMPDNVPLTKIIEGRVVSADFDSLTIENDGKKYVVTPGFRILAYYDADGNPIDVVEVDVEVYLMAYDTSSDKVAVDEHDTREAW